MKIDSFEAAITVTGCPDCFADAGEFCKDREGFPILGECHPRRTTAHKARVATLRNPSHTLRHIMMDQSSVTTVSVRADEAVESARTFDFEITGKANLAIEDIWPDEDERPDNPTLRDVLAKVREWDDLWSFISDWDLEENTRLYVEELASFE